MEWLKQFGWLVTIATALAGAIWGLLTYQHRTRIAFEQPMVQRTIDLCFEASQVAASLSTETATPNWDQKVAAFWELYWGKLAIIESKEVAAAMVNLGREIKVDRNARKELGGLAYRVSLACRDQIEQLMDRGWRIDPSKDLPIKTGLQ